jgi:hypothetical protein
VKHKIKDYTMMKNFMTSRALSSKKFKASIKYTLGGANKHKEERRWSVIESSLDFVKCPLI